MPKAETSGNNFLEPIIFVGLAILALAALVAEMWMPGAFLTISPPCLFDYFGFAHCWGCGMTRAMLACLHGNMALAWELNPGVFVVLPLLGIEYGRLGLRVFSRRFVPLTNFRFQSPQVISQTH